jgi:hypothetical protein
VYPLVTIKTNGATSAAGSSSGRDAQIQQSQTTTLGTAASRMASIPLFRLGLRQSISILPSRHVSHVAFTPPLIKPQPLTPHQFLKQPRSYTLRFFSSTFRQQNRRPYPHRQFNQQQFKKPSFFGFLDDIPQNAVFWGIITINGVVFVMWFMASQRLVRCCYYMMSTLFFMTPPSNNNGISPHTSG